MRPALRRGFFNAVVVAGFSLGAASVHALPTDIDGFSETSLSFWMRANAGVTADGSNNVSQWDDASTAARNATASGGQRPLFVASSGINGFPAIRFSGSSQFFNLPSSSMSPGNSSFTAVAVGRPTNLSTWPSLLGTGPNGVSLQKHGIRLESDGKMVNYFWGPDLLSSPGVTANNNNYLLTYRCELGVPGGWSLRRNGQSVASSTVGSRNEAAGPTYLGWSGNSTEFWSGDIAEIVYFRRALTINETAALEGYLGEKYGVGLQVASPANLTAGVTGVRVLGTSGAAVNTVTHTAGTGTLTGTAVASDPGGSFSGGTATSPDGTVVSPTLLDTSRYWQLTPSGLTTYNAVVTLDTTGMAGVPDLDKAVIVRRPNSASAWVPQNTLRIGATLHAVDQTAFGEYAIAYGDSTPPSVVSITRLSSENPTNDATVTFRVEFSEPVDDSSIDGADFTFTTTGSLSGVSFGSISTGTADDDTVDVVVSTGSGDGDIRLDILAAATISDANANDFNTSYTSGETFTVDKTAPTSSAASADTTQAGGTLDGTYSESDASGIAGVDLYVKEPGGAWTNTGAAAGGVFAYTSTLSGDAADGLYEFATVATDNAGNSETAPTGMDAGDVAILYNNAANGPFTLGTVSDGTFTFPMSDGIDVQISFASASSGGPVTVSRTTGALTPSAGFDEALLIDEALSITGTFSGDATISWTYDPANDDAPGFTGTVDTVFQFETGVQVGSFPVTPTGTTLTVGPVTSFSDWYAGQANASVADWQLFQ